MSPFFFGSGQRRLFGVYEPAHGNGASAVVLCQPWGPEYIYAHRSMRQLARMLNSAGVHTLRFDYYGTGDSSGDFVDSSVESGKTDIATAMEELQAITGTKQVGLVGLRLGASLAAAVAAGRPNEVDALALWDPVVSGGEYLQQLYRDAKLWCEGKGSPEVRRDQRGGGHEVLGFPLTESMAEDFKSIDLASLVQAFPDRTSIVISEPLSSHAGLKEAIAATAVDIINVDSRVPVWLDLGWLSDANQAPGTLPVEALQRITKWFQGSEAPANAS
jgi:uncharacterized protein